MSKLNLEVYEEHCFADVPGDAEWGEEFDLPPSHFVLGSVGRVTRFLEQRGNRVRVKLEITRGYPHPEVLAPPKQKELPVTRAQPLASAQRRRNRLDGVPEQEPGANRNEGYEGNPGYDVGPNEIVTERERFARGQGAYIDGSNKQQVAVPIHSPAPISTVRPSTRAQKAALDQVQMQNMASIPILSSILDQDGHRKQRMSMGYSPEQRQELMIGDMGRKIDRTVGKRGGQSKSAYKDDWAHLEYDQTKSVEHGALVEHEVRFQRGRGFVEVPVTKKTLVPADHVPEEETRRYYMPPTGVPIEPARRGHGTGGRAARKAGFKGRRPGKPRHG